MNVAHNYYAATGAPAPARHALAGEARADVCVVGGGYAGLSAALHLARRGFDVRLLEARTVGFGASGRNGGQVHVGQRLDQEELERALGPDHARRLWALALEAVDLLRALVADHAIDCDLRDGLLHAAWKASHAPALERHAAFMSRAYGHELEWIPPDAIDAHVASRRYHGAVLDRRGGHLHALNYASGLAAAAERAGATIHEDSRALKVEQRSGGVRVVTPEGAVEAAHAVLACDAWLGDLAPAPGAMTLPINSFVLATAPLGRARAAALIPGGAAVADTKFVVDYYRLTADDRLLFGGGETYTARYPADLKRFVRKPMLRVFPQLADVEIDYAWGGAVGITMSRLPHFGFSAPNVAFAHGFSGQGVALATLAGKLLAEATSGALERFDVFASLRHRPIPGGRLMRTPLMAIAMAWHALLDRL